jgi:flagellar biosynthetic protein FliQ
MNGAAVVDIARDTLTTVILISLPMMIVALAVGVVIGLLQALTQVQEMTLVFVPKIIAIFITMLLAFPLMGSLMNGFMVRIIERVIGTT